MGKLTLSVDPSVVKRAKVFKSLRARLARK
jgi:hypothetical protein